MCGVAYAYEQLEGYAYSSQGARRQRRHRPPAVALRQRRRGAPKCCREISSTASCGAASWTATTIRPNAYAVRFGLEAPLPVTAHGRVLLAGDAGGFVHGVTAEGIYYAMVSGELAAKKAVRRPGARGLRPQPTSGCGVERSAPSSSDAAALQRLSFAERSRLADMIGVPPAS